MRAGRPRPGLRLSVRARTTLLATATLVVALAIGSALLFLILDRALLRSGDQSAIARATDVAVLVERGALPRDLSASPDENFVQVVDSGGRVVAGSRGRLDAAPVTSYRPPPGPAEITALPQLPDKAEREDYRVAVLTVGSPRGDVTVYAGWAVESISETRTTLLWTLGWGIPLLVVLLALVTWVLLGRALRPVESIRAEVEELSLGALDRRVPVPASRDEIHRLAVTMNSMLDRLESASLRQRHFVADASHELQSPLAAMRSQLEVLRAHPHSGDWSETTGWLLGDTERMERLVRDMLFLAKSDSPGQGGARQRTARELDLDDIVLEEALRLRQRTGTVIDTTGVSAAPLTGVRDELIRLVRNLLENAVRHAAGVVRVGLDHDDERARLSVADDGGGIAEPDREAVFERFVRLDPDRSRAEGGSGLGLSICREIARRHGGDIVLEDAAPGARFVVELPVSGHGPDRVAHAHE